MSKGKERNIKTCAGCPVFKNESDDGYFLLNCPVLIKRGDENPSVNFETRACGFRSDIETYVEGLEAKKNNELIIVSGTRVVW